MSILLVIHINNEKIYKVVNHYNVSIHDSYYYFKNEIGKYTSFTFKSQLKFYLFLNL